MASLAFGPVGRSVYASSRSLPRTTQNSIPAGWLDLCRGGIAPPGWMRLRLGALPESVEFRAIQCGLLCTLPGRFKCLMVFPECEAEHDHVTIAVHSMEALLGIQETSCHPAHDDLAVFPALDVPGHVAGNGDHRLDGVGGLEGIQQAPAQAKSRDGERFLQSLQQAGSRARVFGVQVFG